MQNASSPWRSTNPLSSVRGRIVVGFAFLVIIIAIGAAGSAWQARTHQSDTAEMEEHATSASLLNEGALSGARGLMGLQRYIATGDETAVPEIRADLAAAAVSLEKALALEAARGNDEEVARLNSIVAGAAFLSETAEQAIALRQTGDVEGAAAVLETAAPRLQQSGLEIDQAAAVESQEVSALRDQARRSGDAAFWFAIVGGLAGAVLALAAAFLIIRSILKPLASLESAASAVAGGDLEKRAPVSGPSELAHLAGSLNQMTDSLLDASKRRELEEALRQSEEHFRSLIENSSDIVTILGTDGGVRYVSPSAGRVLGHTPEDLIGENVFQFVHGDDLPGVLENFSYLLEHPEAPRSTEFRFRHADGSWRALEAIGKRVTDDSGLTAVIVNSRDITDRKQAEEALQLTQFSVDRAADAVFWIGPDARFVYANDAACRSLGYSREELLTMTVHDIDPQFTVDVWPGHWNEIKSRRSFTVESSHRTKEGKTFPVEVTVNYLQFAGEEYNCAFARDISDRKRAEQQLRESEERTRLIVDTAYDAFISIDARGVITSWNARAEDMFGWPRTDAIGRDLASTIIPPQFREAHDRGLERFLATGEGPVLNTRIEIAAMHCDGHEFPVELAVWAVGSEGAWTFHAFVHDISERKQAEEEQRRLNEDLQAERKQIEALNRSLERKVKERTSDLRLANRELQQRNRELLDARAKAATDGLTGLLNHRAFQERIREEFSRAQADGKSVALVMLDIDGFKGINDSSGHQAGDNVLRAVAETLAGEVGQEHVYRYGGDEFAILLPGVDRQKTATTAERLRRSVTKCVDGTSEKVTISLGIASSPETAASADELIYGADAAMYWAKSAGKNRVGDWGKLTTGRGAGSLPWYAADRAVREPDVVAAFVAALAAKDPDTGSHSERCSWYTSQLAEQLGLDEHQTSIARLASLLHDVGKLAVPDSVLSKPEPLSKRDWAQMKKHPAAALRLLSQFRSVTPAIPAILHHHEHFDGSGYPDGLAGDDIPIASRVLLVTDAFDAMTTDRPYRKALSVEDAVEELERNSGSQFDPAVVAAFLRVLDRHGAAPAEAGSHGSGRQRKRQDITA